MSEAVLIFKGREYRFRKPLGDGGARLEVIGLDDWSTVDVDAETYKRLVDEAKRRDAGN